MGKYFSSGHIKERKFTSMQEKSVLEMEDDTNNYSNRDNEFAGSQGKKKQTNKSKCQSTNLYRQVNRLTSRQAEGET